MIRLAGSDLFLDMGRFPWTAHTAGEDARATYPRTS